MARPVILDKNDNLSLFGVKSKFAALRNKFEVCKKCTDFHAFKVSRSLIEGFYTVMNSL